ncbi:MAG: hypothetical protein IJC15_01275 [Clostridia bacterium]|nr:hypothetical protein [Clostridia bacterium]
MSAQMHNIIRRVLVWGGVLFLCAILQTTLFSFLRGVHARPDLMLAAVVAIAIFDSPRAGGVAGIAAGVIIGALGGVGLNLLPLFYMLCGCFFGVWSTHSLSANFPSWLIYMLVGCCGRAIMTLIHLDAVYPVYSLLDVVPGILVPEFLATLLVSPLLYLTLRRAALLFNRRLRMD